MVYNPNIPQGTDNISVSQPQLLENFSQLNTVFSENHYAFDDATAANRGLHQKVTYPLVIANPNAVAPICNTYTKTIDGKQELFFQNNSASTDVYQITSNGGSWTPSLATSSGTAVVLSGAIANGYYWRLQKGYYLWGRLTYTSASVSDTSFRFILPFPAALTNFISYVTGTGPNVDTILEISPTQSWGIPKRLVGDLLTNIPLGTGTNSIIVSGFYQ